ncbi:hypothetical protein FP364_19615 [Citrobacter amalonaticus]|nr:hypothetical protein [Citrobacter amalonaticus]
MAAGWRPFRPLIKKEKTWFFLLCGYQPKINELIFLVYNQALSTCPVTERGLSSLSKTAGWRPFCSDKSQQEKKHIAGNDDNHRQDVEREKLQKNRVMRHHDP